MLIALYRLVQDIFRCYSKRQQSWIDNLYFLGIYVDEDITTYRIWSMNQRIADKFSDYLLVISWHFLPEQSITDFICFFPIWYVFPNLLNDFVWIFRKIVPQILLHLITTFFIILDALDYWRMRQSTSLRLGADEHNTQIGHLVAFFFR